MYRYSNGQISLADFKQPVGMNLKESNRWVKKAQTIPWLEIEKRYAALFTNRKGNVAKPLRLALGACIIQKAGKPVELGAKLDISVVDGWTRLECCSFDAYNEAGNGRAVPSARGALPQPDPGGQNLPKPGESQLLQGAWDPSFRPSSGAAQEG